jgi:hypothetical protein
MGISDMSPSQFDVAKARVEKDVERATGDLAGLQPVAVERSASLSSLLSSYYGHPSVDPPQFEVRKAHVDSEASKARMANDLARLRAAMAKMIALLRSYYGPHTGTSSA